MVSMSYAAMSPADRMPNSVPSAFVTGMAEMFSSRMVRHARSIVTVEFSAGGVSKSRSRTCVRTLLMCTGGWKPKRSSMCLVSSLM